ncbi:MAG: peptidoglycan DD-metalloendopeptidase family protein [Alphaproteobacteria bacterium]|nr:peptidoglycan DD-metalloendopeptidase family protein [Alphaproteobacteria bacterium]
MKKAKDIIKSINLTRIVLVLALLLSVAAVCVVLWWRPTVANVQMTVINEHKTVVLVTSGDTLSKLLLEQGLTHNDVNEISKILKKEADISTLRADRDKLEFLRSDDTSPVSKIVVVPSPWRQVELTCNDEGAWNCKTIDVVRDVRAVWRSGEILDGDSFYLAGQRAGIPAGVLANVYDLLAFEMDFERDVRAGQKFWVMYEENFADDGTKVDNGNVLAISFEALRGNVEMYRFKKADGTIGYYDALGNGAIKSLKRTPINNAKVTSSFSKKRKHPVLGFTRAHKGVDFRAPTGTPIPSAGAGRVVARSYNRGHGNYVKIRHNGSFETLYAHMSRFAKNVKVGTNVKQGQIIGYAGSTGISTGPHLHYEIIKNGVHVNPMTVKLPAISNLGKADKQKFLEYREILDGAIKQLEQFPDMFIQL